MLGAQNASTAQVALIYTNPGLIQQNGFGVQAQCGLRLQTETRFHAPIRECIRGTPAHLSVLVNGFSVAVIVDFFFGGAFFLIS